MWCFVVRTSQISEASVGEGEVDVRRVFLGEEEVSRAALLKMWARRAVEALRSWGRSDIGVWGGWCGLLEIDRAGRASRTGLVLSARLVRAPSLKFESECILLRIDNILSLKFWCMPRFHPSARNFRGADNPEAALACLFGCWLPDLRTLSKPNQWGSISRVSQRLVLSSHALIMASCHDDAVSIDVQLEWDDDVG